MRNNSLDNIKKTDEWKLEISIWNLSEHDKWEILKYLSWENYMQKWEIKTENINDPKDFFEKLNLLPNKEKNNLLNELKEFFENKKKVETEKEWLKWLKAEKNEQNKVQEEKIVDLKNKLNETEEKEWNIEQLKEWWIEITKIIGTITSLGINWIWSTEEDKEEQKDKYLKQIQNKEIPEKYKNKASEFIKKSLDKMYLIKNKYLKWWNMSTEEKQDLICDIMWVKNTEARQEFRNFIKDNKSEVQVEMKWPSLICYIPYIKTFLKRSAYGFSIIETQWDIKNKSDYKKIKRKYLSFWWIKATDEQIQYNDLKGSVIVLNANKWQFKITENVENHEYQHILNQWYLMPEWWEINLQKAIDELLADMPIEDLTNELWLYNYYLEKIKKEKYDKNTPLKEVLVDLKKDPIKYEEYKKDWNNHIENVKKYTNLFFKIMEKTGLDRKTTANMLAIEPIENWKNLTK